MRFLGNFINGKFIKPVRGAKRLLSEDPGDLSHPVGEILFSTAAVDEAVGAARKAFPGWSSLSPKEREAYLVRFQKVLRAHAKELALLITREMGKPLGESGLEVERILGKIDTVRKYELGLISQSSHPLDGGMTAVLRYRPRGVVAVLSPFNLPAHLAVSPALSALATGNAVVLKPSELTPFTAQFLAELWKKAGLPKGVFNLAQGPGEVGRALVTHPGIDAIIFTGSWQTGSKIQTQIQKQPHKICALEMGGKNSAIVLKDCDLSRAADEAFTGAFLTTGQRCNATSRILVERPAAKKFISLFLGKVDRMRVGYGMEPGVFMGPVVSKKVFGHALQFIKKAPGEGFEVLRGGGAFPYKKKGYYLKPSAHLREGMPAFPVKEGSYTDDEILGPDAAIYIVDSLDEAIAINNRTRYGLVVSVFTKSRANFEKVLRGAENGLVNWNVSTTRSSGRLPFGGLKRSGNNRPAGFFSPYLCTIPTSSLERRP